MSYKRCVPNCRSNYDAKGKKYSVFSFPSDQELCKKWVQAIKRGDFTLAKNTQIPNVAVMIVFEPNMLVHILLHLAITKSVLTAFPSNLRYPSIPVTTNKITDLNLTCDSKRVNITLTLKKPFKGVAFAKDFIHECKTFGMSSNQITLSLPTSACGVRLSTTTDQDGAPKMFYTVSLVIQQDKYLRQISDQEKIVHCPLEEEAFLVKSQPMFLALKKEIKSKNVKHRIGRLMREGWSKDLDEKALEEELQEAMTAARAWMEIVPEKGQNRGRGSVEVGETVVLTVKSTLPAGIGWKIVDCIAHDGLGDSSQKLLDESGCPIDEMLLPSPKFGPIKPIASMRHQEASTRFSAFKFPDRDRLHFQCKLQICREACPKIDCLNRNDTTDNRIGRSNFFDLDGGILDKLEVFNSVEVIAPEIDETDDYRSSDNDNIKSSDFNTYPFPRIPGDKTFCVSPDKMAIAFCVLGLIFLIAVVVTVCSILKTRRSKGGTVPYYTRSLFSSSSGAASPFGSKLLLTNESPVSGNSSNSSLARIHYGRII